MHGSYAFSTNYPAPHYEQARQWHRFARLLRRVRRRAYDRKEEALGWSLARGTRALCFPLVLETRPAHDRGLSRLLRRMKGYGGPVESESSLPQRFPELEARTVYLKDEDARRVELLLHASSPGGMASLLPVGYLPDEDGAWSIPLLQQHLSLRFFVYDFIPGTARRGSRGLSATAKVLVVVAGAHEAGRMWIDIYDDRKSACGEYSALRPAGNYVQLTREPTMEDWMREDTWQRETCLSDLSRKDYGRVAVHL
ncbi:MAG: hypothetical protein GVY12_16715 [Bacteroidetes bacterium]|jgi:hypothetical protein|nr:hypothetical protein [Bacteroidota bacterium]